MPSIVAIDIETTGLNPEQDAITEIGAVRFNGHRVENEWTTLVNPRKPIPGAITALTGITNDMVKNAPLLRDVLDEFAAFVGDSPVLGQSVGFDLSFLRKGRVLLDNEVIDTYELAAVLMPTATRYNLGALGDQLGILRTGHSHRALDDARVTMSVFLELYEKALVLPVELIAELVRHSEPFEWGGGWLFQQILKARQREPVTPRKVRDRDQGPLFTQPMAEMYPPLQPVDPPQLLNIEETASLLEYGGPFSQFFESYENRPQQVEMLRWVGRALSESQHLMVEAGTGTGKSFAYLVPAALWAIQNGRRVVISTNTITLQDQLVNKDIPDLRAALNIDLRAAVMKGRSNYLCPRKLEILRQRGPNSVEELRVLGKVLAWLQNGGKGDRNEINLNGPLERESFYRMSADDEGCKNEVCLERTGGACPFFQAKLAAQSAHLLVVNHALLLADIATGSRVLPDYKHLIVDEAHHLEGATTDALSFRATQGDISRLLHELGGTSSGVLGHLMTVLKGMLRPSDFAFFQQTVQRCTDLAFRSEHDFKNFFQTIFMFLEEQREGQPPSQYDQQVRILPVTRAQPMWTEIEIAWDSTVETVKLLCNLLTTLQKTTGEIEGIVPEELGDLQSSLVNILRRLTETEANLTSMVSNPDPARIYWVEVSPDGSKLAAQIAPLHIGPLMEQYLWHEKDSVILTSATLTTNGEFDYIRNRLFADEAAELALGSPFDFETSAMLYLVNDIPEPADAANYQRSVEQVLTRLAKATNGRMLALFTSYTQLKRTSQSINPSLAADGIQVYEQGEGASANILLENFREADKAVLLGTRAFWEGVDIPGDALSVLVIVKLPFDVPSDPIVAARSETFEDPFSEYSLPEAILRFRQGFGRLIRTQSDRGVVVILDRRILSKRYGKMFIESLPECKLRVGSMTELPPAAARWLNL
jgi:ATP-dependent DNA helicase DinG